jgi:hypothetical protein
MQSPLEKPRWTIKIKILVKLLLLKVEMLSLSTIAPPPQTLLGTAVSSTNKHKCHNITEILLKVALSTITLTLYSLQMIVMLYDISDEKFVVTTKSRVDETNE